jgi:ABC-type bacteriocin/lantibiotic exporter with double-glycine peptidase domain
LFAAGIAAMANDAIMLLGIGAVMMFMNWRLALATFAVLPLIMISTWIFPRPRARRQPAHPHGHRADQFVPAGTHQRHERRADF